MNEREQEFRSSREFRDAVRREQIAHGLWLWREGEKRFQRQAAGGRRGSYEVAVERGVEWLQRYSTMEELIHSYFDFAYLGGNELNEEGEDPFAAVCRNVEMMRDNHFVLSATLVEDASYFRRLRQLVGGRIHPSE